MKKEKVRKRKRYDDSEKGKMRKGKDKDEREGGREA